MASTVNETSFYPGGGSVAPLSKLYGNIGGSGDTSIVIKPGANTVNATGSVALKTILQCNLTKTNSTTTTFIAVKTYDNTQGGDIITVTCTSGDTFDWEITGLDAGRTLTQES